MIRRIRRFGKTLQNLILGWNLAWDTAIGTVPGFQLMILACML